MNKRRVASAGIGVVASAGIGVVLLALIAVVIFISSHHDLNGNVASTVISKVDSSAGRDVTPKAPAPAAVAAEVAGNTAPHLELWARPPPNIAARNARRCRLGASLQPWGTTDDNIRAMTDGNIRAVVTQLKSQAQSGDTAAADQLFYMSRITCGFAGMNGAGSPSNASQVLDSQALSAVDGNWIRTVIENENAYKQQMLTVCQQELDTNAAKAWVTAAADQGDAASHYLLAMYGNTHNASFRQAQLLEAVAAGYSRAQYALANLATAGLLVSSSTASSNVNAEELLTAAAADLPQAEGQLAKCEFTGCRDIEIDVPAAVSHAREAAERGAFDTLLEIGPQLQASQIDPDEVEAWRLINAALEMQGYVGGAMNITLMKSASSVLDSPTVTTHAKALADQYWQQYQRQILASLGCGT